MDLSNAFEAEVAKAIVQAGTDGLTELVKKLPALFKRQGKAEVRRVAEEVERTISRLRTVTGSGLERERARQEGTWEAMLRGLLREHPEVADELKALAAEIEAAPSNARSVGGVVGTVNAGGHTYVAGRDLTISQHNFPDRGESQLELSSVTLTESVEAGPLPRSSAVLDLKIRNIGGQPAILHQATLHIHDAVSLSPDHSLGFMPYEELWARGHLQTSHTYDIALPEPEDAGGSQHNLDLSQEIKPAGADRFRIRLGIPPTMDTLIYLLHFDIVYDARRATLTSPAIAIAHPHGSMLVTADEIYDDLHEFQQGVREVRDAIDREMAARGLPKPDWVNRPPASRTDFPPDLRAFDGDSGGLDTLAGRYKVNDTFWEPDSSLAQRLRDIHAYYSRIVNIISGARIRDGSLPEALAQARNVLADLPAVAAEFGVELP